MTQRLLPAVRGPVARILTGSLMGQGLVILVSPLLTRLYTPSDLGALSIVTAIASLFGAAATLGFDRAIVVAAHDSGATALAVLALLSSAMMASGIGAVALVFRHSWAAVMGAPTMAHLWWAIPVTIAAIGAARVASALLARQKAYGALARRNAIQGIGQVACNVALAPLAGPVGLVLGLAAGRGAALIGVASSSRLGPRPSARVLRVALGRYRRYALISLWSSIVNVAGQQAPTLILAAANGSAAVGLIGLTMRVLGSPVGIVADAVSQYFAGMLGGLLRARSPRLSAATLRIIIRLAVIGLIGVVITVLTGPSVFGAVFGSEWRQAGVYAQVLVPAFASMIVVSPISQSLPLLERQASQFAWDIGRLVLTSGVIVTLTSLDTPIIETLAAYSAASVVSYIAMLVLVLRALRDRQRTEQ